MSNQRHQKNNLDRHKKRTEQTSLARTFRITVGVIWNLFLVFSGLALLGLIFGLSVGLGYFAYLVSDEPLRSKEEMRSAVLNYEETSELYFSDEQYLGKINTDIERQETTLENISPYLIDAVIATEDEHFYEHNGIVPKAIGRSILQDVTNSNQQTGGSTLTQQLIKNQILTNEVSYSRKAKEILLAMRLEHFMKKDEILEAYLNVIPYGRDAIGQNIAGIETAAQGIFGISAKELNLPQAAFLAGIPQAPYTYTPFQSRANGGDLKRKEQLQKGLNRMQTVLYRMKETGKITESEYIQAKAYDVTADFRDKFPRSTEKYPYLTQEIQNETIQILSRLLAKEDGLDPKRLKQEKKLQEKYYMLAERAMRTEGYKIYSTVHKDLYEQMNEEARNFQYYGFTYTVEKTDPETGETVLQEDPVQVGSIMIENKTGRILSFVGGRDYQLTNLNHATQAYRQNGSSMKPLLVYAPAIEYGKIGAGSPVVDVKFTTLAGGEEWSPSNYVSSYEAGIIPAREALAKSLNIATARLYYDIIEKRPAEFLEKMGFSRLTEGDFKNLSASFGGLEQGVSVKENTNAFATLGNEGKFVEAHIVERIEDRDGNVIFKQKYDEVEVFSPETAYMISDMLRDVTKPGNTGEHIFNYMNYRPDLAVKTGTTDFHADSWIVGYTPNVSLGVWFGYKDKKVGSIRRDLSKRSALHPTVRTSMFFGKMMNTANEVTPEIVRAEDTFKKPKGVEKHSFCSISGLAPSNACSAAGLVSSDLFYAKKLLPTEPDDSIISASYVSIKGKKYLALPSTPDEFVTFGGTGVNQQFIDRMLGSLGGEPTSLFPSNSSFANNVVSGNVFTPDDEAPKGVKVSANGSTLQWTASPSNDVIGYYVLKDGVRVATIKDGMSRSYQMYNSGTYSVVAVDITGLRSSPAYYEYSYAPTYSTYEEDDEEEDSSNNWSNNWSNNNPSTDSQNEQTNDRETNQPTPVPTPVPTPEPAPAPEEPETDDPVENDEES